MNNPDDNGVKYSEILVLIGWHAQQAAPLAEAFQHDGEKFQEHLQRIVKLASALADAALKEGTDA